MKWFSKKKTKIKNEEELMVTETIKLDEPVATVPVEEQPVEKTPEPVKELPVEEPVIPMELQPTMQEKSDKIFVVNCNKCGASLKVKDGAFAYICGHCNNLFQIRKISKLVKENGAEVPVETPAPAEETTETPVEMPVETSAEDVQLDISDIPVQETTEDVVDEIPAEETTETAEPTEEVEEAVAEEKFAPIPEWVPATDESEEDGWEEDDRRSELPVWQEDEPEEGWDEEE